MASQRSIRPLLLAGVFVALISGLFGAACYVRFNLSPWVVPGHVSIVLGFFLASLLAAGVLRAARNGNRWLTVLPVGLFSLALCQLYVWNAIGWALRIDAISFRLLGYYVTQLFRASLASAPLAYVLFLAPSALAIGFVLFLFVHAAPSLFRSISYAVDPGGLALFGRKRIARNGSVALLLYLSLCVGFFLPAMDLVRFSGEPVLSLFHPIRPARDQLPRGFYNPVRRESAEEGARPAVPNAREKSVILIVIDSLRADHLAPFGYSRNTAPFLSRRLATSPVLMAQWATSACSISECGILAIATSRPFQRLNAGLLGLPEALHHAGYGTYFLVSGDFTKEYPGLYTLAGNHADLFADGLSNRQYGAYDDRVVLRALEKVPNRGSKPAFFYIHLHSAHVLGESFDPPVYRPTGLALSSMIRIGVRGFELRKGNFLEKVAGFPTVSSLAGPEMDRQMLTNNYDNGIRQADGVVEQVLLHLKRKGYLDRSVIVITADHGESLGEHGAWAHGFNLYAESINIPLFFFDSDLGASRAVSYASHLDIAPTVADLVGIPVPAPWEGRSLLRTSDSGISTAQTTSARPIQAIIWRNGGSSYKYLFDTLDNTEELFELESDPAEKANMIPNADSAMLAFLRETRRRRFGATLGETLRISKP